MSLAYKRRDQAAYTQSIADYLPNGPLFAAKNINGSNLRDFMSGLACLFLRTNGLISEYADDVSPLVTQKFLEEWESALGIPDDCLSPYEDPETKGLSSLSSASFIATGTTGSAHGWETGTLVRIRGALETYFNGFYNITVTGATTFTYPVTDGTSQPATTSTLLTAETTTIFKSNTDRQIQIVGKLSYMACQTAQDFIDLALYFGYVITITPGIDDVSGATAGLTDREKRFTIVVNSPLSDANEFPLEFPILFGSDSANFLRCLLQDCDSASCQILYNFTG